MISACYAQWEELVRMSSEKQNINHIKAEDFQSELKELLSDNDTKKLLFKRICCFNRRDN